MNNLIQYVIKKDDKLEKIALEHNMKLEELIEANGIKDRAKLGIGNILLVKGKEKNE